MQMHIFFEVAYGGSTNEDGEVAPAVTARQILGYTDGWPDRAQTCLLRKGRGPQRLMDLALGESDDGALNAWLVIGGPGNDNDDADIASTNLIAKYVPREYSDSD